MNLDGQDVEAIADALAPRVAALIAEHEPLPGALLDSKQAATYLNMPESWVRAEARANRIPVVRMGRYVRYDRTDLEAWRNDRKEGQLRRAGDLRAA